MGRKRTERPNKLWLVLTLLLVVGGGRVVQGHGCAAQEPPPDVRECCRAGSTDGRCGVSAGGFG